MASALLKTMFWFCLHDLQCELPLLISYNNFPLVLCRLRFNLWFCCRILVMQTLLEIFLFHKGSFYSTSKEGTEMLWTVTKFELALPIEDSWTTYTVQLLEQATRRWHERPKGSVAYVSFGSVAELEREQMQELAWGLRRRKNSFLWVVNNEYQRCLLIQNKNFAGTHCKFWTLKFFFFFFFEKIFFIFD